MPIYAYKCESCGHAKDVLQKMSDPLLTVCPSCGAATFQKQLTSAGFQLKGSGWYVTDFRGGDAAKGKDDGKSAEAGTDNKTAGDAAVKPGESSAEKTSASSAAPAPDTAPVKAPVPSTPAPAASPASSKSLPSAAA